MYAAPTVITWLHILGKMPSLEWIGIINAISSATTQTSFPTVHLLHLDRLCVVGEFHESITLVNQLIIHPRCSLTLELSHAPFGLDQHILYSILDKKLDFWEKDSPNRRFAAGLDEDSTFMGNSFSLTTWNFSDAEEVNHGRVLPPDPPLIISLHSLDSDLAISLFSRCSVFLNVPSRIRYPLRCGLTMKQQMP